MRNRLASGRGNQSGAVQLLPIVETGLWPAMTEPDIPNLCQAIAALMRQRLGARGETLAQTLRQRGRRLPRRVRREAARLAYVEVLCAHPRLRQRVNSAKAAQSGRIVLDYLQPLGAADRRKRLLLGIAGSMALGLLATILGVIAVLIWRGYL